MQEHNKMKNTIKQLLYETFKIFVFALLISLIIPNTEASIRTDLWLYSNLTSSAVDSSGNSRSGTVNGATAITSGGVISGTGYYYFTTNDYISYNGYGMLDNGNKQNFTINIWVDANTDAGFYTIWSEGCTTDDDCIFTARGNSDSDGKAETYMRDQDGVVKISSVENTRATFNQTWTMLTWVRGGQNWRVYVNGQSAASGTGLNPNVANFNTFNLGVLQRLGLALYMEGNLTEFGVWNRTFNSDDVSGLYSMYLDGCNPINNATLCGTPPSTNQTPTPTALKNTSIGYTNVTLNFTGNMGSKYLLYQNGSNVVNFTTRPYTRTGLTTGTGYSFYIKAYNTSYTTALSNASNTITLRTRALPTLSLKTNIINYENYTTNPFVFRFNGTTTGTNQSFYCKLWSPYNTKSIMDKWITNITKNQNMTFDTTLYESPYGSTGYVPLNLTCVNNEITLPNAMISRAVWIDSVKPSITYTGLNNSKYYRKVNTALPFVLTYSDDNLYVINTTLCASASGTTCTQQISNWVSTSLTDDTRLVNVTNTLASLPTAYSRYFIFGQAWDGHTAAEIPNYKITQENNVYGTGALIEDKITIASPTAKDFVLNKGVDRYSFDITLNSTTDTILFNLLSSGNLTYNKNSDYLGHFIDFENRKWIDFESTEVKGVKVTKVNDNYYQVEIKTKSIKNKDSKITFNSIGDLNYVPMYLYFNISNSSTIKAYDKITGQQIQNITAKIYTYPNTLIQTKSTNNYNLSLNITSGTYYVNISGSADGTNYITNVTANYTFTQNSVLSRFLTLENSLYLFIRDEQTNELITDRNVTIDVINYANESFRYTTGTGSTFQSGFAAGYYEINYKATNYTARSYYTTISGSDTQTITLYLLNNLDSTHAYKLFEILDDSASPLPNATLKLQRYMINDSAWRVMEMSKTNDEGKGFIFVELYDATYRFVIEYEGVTRKTTSETKLDTRDMFISLELLTTGLDSFFKVSGVTTSLVYSNATKILTFNYDGSTISEVDEARFLVTQRLPTIETTICNATLVATSGGMNCNLTSYWDDGGEFYAQGYITTDDGVEHLVKLESIITNEDTLRFGLNGVLLSMMIIGTLAFLGLFNPTIAILFALVGLVITTAAGLLYLSASWVIGIIVVGLIFIFTMRT